MKEDLVHKVDLASLKQFEEDVVWRAFREVVEERIEVVRNELEVGFVYIKTKDGGQTVLMTEEGTQRRRGECEGLRYILKLPDILKEIWEQDKKVKEEKKEE